MKHEIKKKVLEGFSKFQMFFLKLLEALESCKRIFEYLLKSLEDHQCCSFFLN